MSGSILSVQNLSVNIENRGGSLLPVDGISFDLERGKIHGLAGESGCGKTLTALSITGLLPFSAQASGTINFYNAEGKNYGNLLGMNDKELCRIRGKEISIIFQEPISSLNPLKKIGKQIIEPLEIHGKKNRRQNIKLAIELMGKLGLKNPELLMEAYPSNLSGGMGQRVMIALAMISEPALLIADEPTTALDIKTQEQILELLLLLNKNHGTTILLISHDLGIIKRLCSKVIIMHKGKIAEQGGAEQIFLNPAHQHTKELLSCVLEESP